MSGPRNRSVRSTFSPTPGPARRSSTWVIPAGSPASARSPTILAITKAICDYRRAQRIDGPLFLGKDTHALSGPAQRTALEVLAAEGVEVILQRDDGVTPTPVISHAILVHNRGRVDHLSDGIV